MHRLCDRELTVATAESCTGGMLAALLTDIEGAGHGFDRGFVTYTKDAKHDLLGIERDVLDRNDAVSEVVARAMAEGALSARMPTSPSASPASPARPATAAKRAWSISRWPAATVPPGTAKSTSERSAAARSA